MKMPDIVVDMNREDGGDSNQSCWGFVLPRFLFLGSHSIRGLTSSEEESKGETLKTQTDTDYSDVYTHAHAHMLCRDPYILLKSSDRQKKKSSKPPDDANVYFCSLLSFWCTVSRSTDTKSAHHSWGNGVSDRGRGSGEATVCKAHESLGSIIQYSHPRLCIFQQFASKNLPTGSNPRIMLGGE